MTIKVEVPNSLKVENGICNWKQSKSSIYAKIQNLKQKLKPLLHNHFQNSDTRNGCSTKSKDIFLTKISKTTLSFFRTELFKTWTSTAWIEQLYLSKKFITRQSSRAACLRELVQKSASLFYHNDRKSISSKRAKGYCKKASEMIK